MLMGVIPFGNLIDESDIRECIESGQVRLTVHVRERMDQRDITTDELFQSLKKGKITERYPGDEPFPSCLIKGETQKGRPISVVCSLSPENILVLITTYVQEGE